MIVKEYWRGINVTDPNGYFENWYADMWKRCINSHIAEPNQLKEAVYNELKKVGADVECTNGDHKYKVTFDEDNNYIIFVLKWS